MFKFLAVLEYACAQNLKLGSQGESAEGEA
ncbi:Uncharacterised protein [Achromobacter xylosoxidans]|jgi:hypothetical protein|nr:Uncharacterised protein [Achromobacter xylosoxidans]SEI38099.1 hypothetical protein SAMN05216318_10190 [Nitrosomonas eutropha]